jgi:2-polyprenyl-3-methyl-5-hydroxy-6-metoxy-1,4-benzoquinol methylase
VAEASDAIAAGHDEFVAPDEASLANAGLRLTGLNLGERFLDVAAGPGGLSLPAARLGAEVLATEQQATVRRVGLQNDVSRWAATVP